jgi:predicted DsbA family dithiol-disulfide isomerase
MPAAPTAPLGIDLFVDIVCPWCFVGTERLERVLASLGLEAPGVILRHHPFFLDPNTPPEGENIPEMLRRKYGASDPRPLWARLEAQARSAGIELDLSKQATMYPTARAHTLIRHAGPRGTQRALVRQLFRSYFLDARNIDDPAVLAEIAAGHGFSVEEVAALVAHAAELAVTSRQAHEAAASGIRGVPFFILDERLAISGAQTEQVFREAIARVRGHSV